MLLCMDDMLLLVQCKSNIRQQYCLLAVTAAPYSVYISISGLLLIKEPVDMAVTQRDVRCLVSTRQERNKRITVIKRCMSSFSRCSMHRLYQMPVLHWQGTPKFRLSRNHDAMLQRENEKCSTSYCIMKFLFILRLSSLSRIILCKSNLRAPPI